MLAIEFTERFDLFKFDKKDETTALRLTVEEFNSKIDHPNCTHSGYAFIDKSKCMLCNNNRWEYSISKN